MELSQVLTSLLLVVAFLHRTSVIGDSPPTDEDNNHAIVAVETEDDTSGEIVTKLDVEFGKDVYDPDLPEFEPSQEWKPIRQGQAIPRGLHVRLNLETGEKEAKLLPDDDGERFQRDKTKKTSYSGQGHPARLQAMKDQIEQAMKALEKDKDNGEYKYWKEGDSEGMMNMNKKSFSRDELKEALKNFKTSKDDTKESHELKENVYRNIDAIKKDFADLKLEMKTDFEILKDLLTKYNDTNLEVEQRVNILTDFEYYLHQIDNAKVFADMGGIEMVTADLNSTNENVRSEAAFVIGSAVQSNPPVQVKALQCGVMQQLIRMLFTDTEIKVRSRVMYAIASLIRNFPFAQQSFFKLGGLQAFSNLFKESNTEKLQLRAVTLISDLTVEFKTNKGNLDSTDPVSRERAAQYAKVPIMPSLMEHGWCQSLPSLLSTSEHDSREKALNGMKELVEDCWASFRQSLPLLKNLKREYQTLASREKNDNDQYFRGILKTVEDLIDSIYVLSNDEL